MIRNIFLGIFCIILPLISQAQNTRLKDPNDIGWYVLNTTVSLNDKWSVVNELHGRRVKVISDPQQSIIKLAVNRLAMPGVNVRAGYAFIETYNYGDYPLNNLGKQFTEHRAYEMVSLTNSIGRGEHTHRFMLEQRWVGRYSSAALEQEDEYIFTNRFRYMYRFQIPLKGRVTADKTPYLAAYDEVMVSFGKNVNENVFDQNRIAVLLGYRFSPKLRIEGGFISQIAQLGREIGGQNVFQYNSGITLSTNLNF